MTKYYIKISKSILLKICKDFDNQINVPCPYCDNLISTVTDHNKKCKMKIYYSNYARQQ
jgi:hypothetical protein